MAPGYVRALPLFHPKALFDKAGGNGDAVIHLLVFTQAGAAAELPFKQTQ